MDTSILTPKALFRKDIRYTIPAFQRRYVWTQDDHWEPLWEDVCNAADDYLENLNESDGERVAAEQKTSPHFLGAIVVQLVNTATKDVERREVIDGQQRLTTLQLLLDAVQYVYERRGAKQVAKRLSKLVKNDAELIEEEDHIFKLWPTTNDRLAFKHAMDNGLATDGHENSLVVQAHEYFQMQAEHWLGLDCESSNTRMEALETAVTGMLQMVVIDLTPRDDPNVIFETLNARGTPLSESNLIKNYVTSKAAQANQEDIWGDLDHDWWQKEFRQGRLLRPRIDALLDYWLEMHTLDDVSAGRVFNVFKTIAATGQPIGDIMSDIKAALNNYRSYEEGKREPTEDQFHYRAGVMQMRAFTPALLCILATPPQARFTALQALESFLVRRMVCRETTKDYSRLTLDLVRELQKDREENLQKHREENTGRVVVDFLSGQTAYSRRWPTNEDLEHQLTTLPLYRLLTKGRLRMVLEGIEQKYREDHFAEQTDVPQNLTIEHVLPQSWKEHWPLPNTVDELEAKQNRNQLVHTIGNLTLISGRLNSAVSNASWDRKRETLEKHSTFFLNRVLLAESKDTTWDEQFIEARSKKMAEMVAEVWPGPNSAAWDM